MRAWSTLFHRNSTHGQWKPVIIVSKVYKYGYFSSLDKTFINPWRRMDYFYDGLILGGLYHSHCQAPFTAIIAGKSRLFYNSDSF